MTKITINARLLWKFAQNQESGNWVAVCEDLHMAVEGDSFRDLIDTMNETLHHVFADLLATGRLDSFLRAHNWAPVSEIPAQNIRNPRFDIPFETRRVNERDLQAAFC